MFLLNSYRFIIYDKTSIWDGDKVNSPEVVDATAYWAIKPMDSSTYADEFGKSLNVVTDISATAYWAIKHMEIGTYDGELEETIYVAGLTGGLEDL